MSVRQAGIERVYNVCEGRKSSDTLSPFVSSSITFIPHAFTGWKTSHHQKHKSWNGWKEVRAAEKIIFFSRTKVVTCKLSARK